MLVGLALLMLFSTNPLTHERRSMNIKKKWLQSLAVAGVVAMVSANASAEVLAISAATEDYELGFTSRPVIPGVQSSLFKHAGGPLTALYTAECAVATPAGGVPPGAPPATVAVQFQILDAAGKDVASLAPGRQTLCTETGLGKRAVHTATGVASLPAGVYRVQVLGSIPNARTATGLMGKRSLVVSR